MLEHSVNLLATDARKPFEKLEYGRAPFEVLEESSDGDPRPAKEPLAADLTMNAFHSLACRPIEHIEVYMPVTPLRKRDRESRLHWLRKRDHAQVGATLP